MIRRFQFLVLALCSILAGPAVAIGGGLAASDVEGAKAATCSEAAAHLERYVGTRLLRRGENKNKGHLYEGDLPKPLRILPPGSMATMDFSPNRLNVYLDDQGRITKIRCG
ncbi:MAG: I78 family peptidase inhibitor [Rhodospirillales bacterium]|nr:I78 family peptidase inhibitor [Rhodospirillales bacterium]